MRTPTAGSTSQQRLARWSLSAIALLANPRSNVAVELLRHLGANPEVVRTRVLADLGKAA